MGNGDRVIRKVAPLAAMTNEVSNLYRGWDRVLTHVSLEL